MGMGYNNAVNNISIDTNSLTFILNTGKLASGMVEMQVANIRGDNIFSVQR
jgi:hypothetical protein